MPKDTSGAAFPRLKNVIAERRASDGKQVDRCEGSDGLTKREWFAGQALAGWLASFAGVDPDMTPDPTGTAELCYRIADAMIKAGEG